MKTELLQAFYTLSHTLNYRETAERLYLSQSALTRQITALEKEWGIPLFVRSTRSVKLTKKGQALLRDVEKLLQCEEVLQAHVQALSHSSSVTVGYYGAPNLAFVSVLFGEWSKAFPHGYLNVVTDSLTPLLKKLAEGELDCLFILKPSVADLENVRCISVEKQCPAVTLRADHPLASEPMITMEQLRLSGPVLLPRGFNPHADNALLKLCRLHGVDVARFVHEETMNLHVSGDGLPGLRPVYLPDPKRNFGNTISIPLDEPQGMFDRVLAYPTYSENDAFPDFLRIVQHCVDADLFPSHYCNK